MPICTRSKRGADGIDNAIQNFKIANIGTQPERGPISLQLRIGDSRIPPDRTVLDLSRCRFSLQNPAQIRRVPWSPPVANCPIISNRGSLKGALWSMAKVNDQELRAKVGLPAQVLRGAVGMAGTVRHRGG